MSSNAVEQSSSRSFSAVWVYLQEDRLVMPFHSTLRYFIHSPVSLLLCIPVKVRSNLIDVRWSFVCVCGGGINSLTCGKCRALCVLPPVVLTCRSLRPIFEDRCISVKPRKKRKPRSHE